MVRGASPLGPLTLFNRFRSTSGLSRGRFRGSGPTRSRALPPCHIAPMSHRSARSRSRPTLDGLALGTNPRFSRAEISPRSCRASLPRHEQSKEWSPPRDAESLFSEPSAEAIEIPTTKTDGLLDIAAASGEVDHAGTSQTQKRRPLCAMVATAGSTTEQKGAAKWRYEVM